MVDEPRRGTSDRDTCQCSLSHLLNEIDRQSLKLVDGNRRSWIEAAVGKTAIGSLLPDSSSSVDARFSSSVTPCDRRIENTAAASVDETIAPSRNACAIESPSAYATTIATTAELITTPRVESDKARQRLRRTNGQLVSSSPGEQDEGKGDDSNPLRRLCVVEIDPSDALGAGEHANREKQHHRRHTEPPGGLTRDDADEEQQPHADQQTVERNFEHNLRHDAQYIVMAPSGDAASDVRVRDERSHGPGRTTE